MKGDIPKKIRIDNVVYKVALVPNLVDENGTAVYGLTHFDKQLIEIDSALGEDLTRNTLAHEVRHCVFFERGLHDLVIDREVFETIIDESAKGDIRALKDNPDLVAYYCKKEKKPRKKKEKVNAENPQLPDKNIV